MRKKDLKPTPYWEAQREALLKHNPKNLVTPTGAPLPPNSTHEPTTNELLDALKSAPGHKYPPGTTDEDKAFAAELVSQIKTVAVAGLMGYEITEAWYAPPEAQ